MTRKEKVEIHARGRDLFYEGVPLSAVHEFVPRSCELPMTYLEQLRAGWLEEQENIRGELLPTVK